MFRALSVVVIAAVAAATVAAPVSADSPDPRHTRVAVVASLFDSPDAALAARGIVDPQLVVTATHIEVDEEMVDAHRHDENGNPVEVHAPNDNELPSFEMAPTPVTTPPAATTGTSTGTTQTGTGSTATTADADTTTLAPGVVGGLAAPSAQMYQNWASGAVGVGRTSNGAAASTDAGSVVCPVPGSKFINDWGYGRSGGRTHKGTDMFAPVGTPIVAVSDAWITKVDRTNTYRVGSGTGDLGGITVSYVTDRGDRWYNAHLSAVAPGIEVGVRVTQGQQVGSVGNTGNAATTPPHNHIGWFPGGGEAANPFPVISVACPGH